MNNVLSKPFFSSRIFLLNIAILLFTLLFGGGIASAANVNVPENIEVPSSTEPGQVEKRFSEPQGVLQSPNILPVPGAGAPSQEEQEKLSKIKFTLKEVEITGATVYSASDLSFAYADLIGKNISLLDADGIAQKITGFYHQGGYVLSQAIVPPQDVTKGILKIRVIEGYVGNVIIPDDVGTPSERSVIEGYADHIKQERPSNTATLEHYLLLINDLPGVTVNGLLKPSATEVGSADLVINVTNKPFDASYVLDNRGSKYIGPWQHTLSGTANSLFGVYDSTRLRLFTTSPDDNQLFGAELMHEEEIGTQGAKVTFLASHTHTEPGNSLAPLDIVGNSNLFETKLTQPFIRSRGENLVGRVLFDYRDTDTDIFKTTTYTYDRLRSARFGMTYNIIDPLRGNNVIDTQLSQGMDILGATGSGVDRSNVNGDASYTKINTDLSRLQPLPNNFSFLTAGSMQHAFNPLLADEQFSLGGTEYGRAFDPAELLGDQGLAGKMELRYTGAVDERFFQTYQLYTFYDIGRIWLIDGAVGSSATSVLSSAGVGTRLSFTDNFSANFEIAVPLVAPSNDPTDYRGDPRLFMNLVARF